MEVMTIVGIRSVSFKDDQGQEVRGVSFYATYPATGVDGVCTDKLFVSEQKLMNLSYVPQLGDRVRVFYNKYGKPADFELLN